MHTMHILLSLMSLFFLERGPGITVLKTLNPRYANKSILAFAPFPRHANKSIFAFAHFFTTTVSKTLNPRYANNSIVAVAPFFTVTGSKS